MIHASPLEYAILGLLKQKPQSGYDLRKSFVSTPMRHFSDSPGSIYPALRRLQARRWISVFRQEDGRKRQVLQLTAAGKGAFTAWLKEVPTREDVIWRMDELLIRFAFQGDNVSADVTLAFLTELEKQLHAYLQELRDYAKEFGLAKAASTGALAFANGIGGYEAQLAWVQSARRRFTETRS